MGFFLQSIMKLKKNPRESFLDTINQIQLAIKSTGVYPEDHPIAIGILNNSYDTLNHHLAARGVLTCSVLGGKFLVDDIPLDSPNSLSANFAQDLEQKAIESISFNRGLTRRDYQLFIKAMIQRVPSQSKGGNMASLLEQNGVSHIRLNEIRYKKVSGKSTKVDDSPAVDYFAPATDTHVKEEKGHGQFKKGPLTDDGDKILDYVHDLLSGEKKNEIDIFVEDGSAKGEDKSGEIRKKIAERLEGVTAAFDEFDTLKENFQKISDTLINWAKKESHVDTYLAVTKSLHNICISLNKMERYLTGETSGRDRQRRG